MGSVSYGLGADLSRSVRRSGTTSRGTVVLVFCLRMRSFLLTLVLTIFVGIKGIA